jgi:hypothetical protein
VVIETEPNDTPGALVEALIAPGQPILINAAQSTAVCPTLQYQFTRVGFGIVRPWSENPVYIDGPSAASTSYQVDVRCSTDLSCTGQATVVVTTVCPDATNAQPFLDDISGFGNDSGTTDQVSEQILAAFGSCAGGVNVGKACTVVGDCPTSSCTANKFVWRWGTTRDVRVWKGNLSQVAAYTPGIAPFNPQSLPLTTQFTDTVVPAANAGFYYLVRDTHYCNDVYSTQYSNEFNSPGRDTVPVCVGGTQNGMNCAVPGPCTGGGGVCNLGLP